MAKAPPTYTQPMQRRWAYGQGNYKGCGLVKEGKGPIFGIQLGPLLEGALLGRHLYPK